MFTFGLVLLIYQVLYFVEISVNHVVGRNVVLKSNNTIYYYLLGIAVVTIIVAYLIKRSKYGLALQSIGENEEAARHMGINVTMVKIITYAVSSMFMGAAGVIMATKLTYVDPGTAFDPLMSFNPVLMAIFGGLGNHGGSRGLHESRPALERGGTLERIDVEPAVAKQRRRHPELPLAPVDHQQIGKGLALDPGQASLERLAHAGEVVPTPGLADLVAPVVGLLGLAALEDHPARHGESALQIRALFWSLSVQRRWNGQHDWILRVTIDAAGLRCPHLAWTRPTFSRTSMTGTVRNRKSRGGTKSASKMA